MAAASELDFSKILMFILYIQAKLQIDCEEHQDEEQSDHNPVKNNDINDEIAKKIRCVMDSYQSLSVKDQHTSLKLFIGEMIMHMMMENMISKCKEYNNDDEFKSVMEEKVQQLLSENCKLEMKNTALESLLEDKSADVVFLTDKIDKMKDLMKRMDERIHAQQQHIEYLQKQELTMMGMIDKEKHLATH